MNWSAEVLLVESKTYPFAPLFGRGTYVLRSLTAIGLKSAELNLPPFAAMQSPQVTAPGQLAKWKEAGIVAAVAKLYPAGLVPVTSAEKSPARWAAVKTVALPPPFVPGTTWRVPW